MSAPIVILVIVAANLLLGWLLLKYFSSPSRFVGSILEQLFISLTFGITFTGWIALILAEFGIYSISLLGLLWLFWVALFSVANWRKRGQIHEQNQEKAPATAASHFARLHIDFIPDWLEYVVICAWLVAAIWLFFRPHQYVNGAADAGVYVNLGAEIAQNGSILIQDDFLAGLDTSLYPAFLRPLNNPVAPSYLFPAFYVVGDPVGEITPQFYPLHPVWQATAFVLSNNLQEGVRAELLLTGMWGLLGALAVYFTVREIAGWQTAVLALVGITLNALQIWFARYPVSEALSQYLLWSGLWSLGVWLNGRKPQPMWAFLAGLSLGQLFLTRIDAIFILPVFALLAFWLWQRAKQRQAVGWFFIPFTTLVIHSLLHALSQSRPYFYDLFNFGTRLLTNNLPFAVGGFMAGLVILLLFTRLKGGSLKLSRYQRPLAIIAITILFLFAGYLWFIRPTLEPPPPWQDTYSTGIIPIVNHENLIRLGWYLSPVGVWLGIGGIALLIWCVNKKTAVMLAVGLLYSAIYLWNIRANPHQIYAMRRYVPTVMPLFIMGAAVAIGWLTTYQKRWLKAVAIILAIAWLGGLAWSARGFISQVDHPDIVTQLSQLSDQFAPDAVLIFNDPAPIGQGDIIGTPLRFLFRYDVLTLRDVEQLDLVQFEQQLRQWQQSGTPVYWIMVPNGQEWPLDNWQIEPINNYSIQTTALENVYTRRPTAVNPQTWQGNINLITQQETP